MSAAAWFALFVGAALLFFAIALFVAVRGVHDLRALLRPPTSGDDDSNG